MSDWVDGLGLAAAVACGLAGGVFFAFSTFVMGGLRELPAAQGAAAMQAVNRAAPGPPLMALLFGAALACVALAVWALTSWSDPRAVWFLLAAVVYVVGAIVVTIAANVPLNDTLAAATGPDAAGAWERYTGPWLAWNHVRLLASLVAAALLAVGLAEG